MTAPRDQKGADPASRSTPLALSWRQVLELIPFSRRALQIRIARGEFPRPVTVGGKVLFDHGEIVAWWEERKADRAATGGA